MSPNQCDLTSISSLAIKALKALGSLRARAANTVKDPAMAEITLMIILPVE